MRPTTSHALVLALAGIGLIAGMTAAPARSAAIAAPAPKAAAIRLAPFVIGEHYLDHSGPELRGYLRGGDLCTVQLKVTSEDGRPASNTLGGVELVNTDDVTRAQVDVPIVNGTGRIAVPAGHYSAFAFFVDGSPKQPTAGRAVIVQDFTVRTATTVPVHERSATDSISVAVPRPASEDMLDAGFYRLAAAGNYAYTGFALPAGIPLYVSPVPVAKTGRLHYVVQWGAMAPGAHPGYRYDVAFAFDHIPADEAFRMRPDQFATVHQHFSADPGGIPPGGQLFNGPVDQVTARGVPTRSGVNEIFTDAGQNGEAMPGDLTDYLGTADGDRWAQMVNTGFGTILTADVHSFRAGHVYSVSWTHGPLAPGFGRHVGAQPCTACLGGRTLSLGFNPQGDSEPDHLTWEGRLFQPLVLTADYHFAIYRNGVKLAGSGSQPGLVVAAVADSAATFRATLDVELPGPYLTQSTHTVTDLTFRYDRASAARLPAEDSCAGGSARTPCRILPVLSLGYRLATDESNTTRAAVQTMVLSVSHLSYDGAESRAAIRAVSVWISFNRGATWQRVRAHGSRGRYAVSWANPASAHGTRPAIRVTASDTIGGSITQTIFNAYTIAARLPGLTGERTSRRRHQLAASRRSCSQHA